MATVTRREMKYVLSCVDYRRVRSALQPHMQQDAFTSEGGGYVVRSLYFDTRCYRAYHDKLDGLYGRIKLRMRCYARSQADTDRVSVQIKAKMGDATEKYSAFVPVEAYEEFMQTRHWTGPTEPVQEEFERLVLVHSQQPTLLVDYAREGYKARDGSDLRITFDHEVESMGASTLFPFHSFFRSHQRNAVILEVKCSGRRPAWLQTLIREQRLRLWQNSKYTQGVIVARPELSSAVTGLRRWDSAGLSGHTHTPSDSRQVVRQ